MLKDSTQEKMQHQPMLTLKEYKKLNKSLTKKINLKSNLQILGKAGLVASMPFIPLESALAQCQGFNISGELINNQGGNRSINLDGAGGNDINFYANQGNFYVQRLAASMSIVCTNGGYPTNSAFGFANGAAIPGAQTVFRTKAFMFYNFGANGNFTSGNTRYVGIKIGSDYGFIEFRLNNYNNPNYSIDIPEGGAPQAGTGNSPAGDCNSLLPVELTGFFIKTIGKDALLTWRTSSELNNAGFQIQRSEDGENFTTIHWEEGRGTTYETINYEFLDRDLATGKTYYYRLNQVDYDGESSISPVVTANILGATVSLSDFYPNPAKETAKIDFSAVNFGECTVEVYDVRGVQVLRNTFNVVEGKNVLTLNVAELVSGNYFVKFENGQERLYKNLVID